MRNIIGETVKGIVDRPIGSHHPGHSETVYPINYGYVEGIIADDEENQDVYILGTDEPISVTIYPSCVIICPILCNNFLAILCNDYRTIRKRLPPISVTIIFP